MTVAQSQIKQIKIYFIDGSILVLTFREDKIEKEVYGS